MIRPTNTLDAKREGAALPLRRIAAGMALTAAGCLNAWAAPADGRTPASSASNARPGTEQREIEDLQSQLRDVQGRLDQLAEQNRQLMEKLQQVLSSSAAASAAAQVPVPVTGPVPVAGGTAMPLTAPVSAGGGAAAASGAMTVSGPAAAATAGTGLANTAGSGVRLWGYGELYYTDPTHDREKAQADLARAVFGIGYAFDSRTEFNSEFEVEHAVSSASDPGEFEVEQFYVDRQLNDAATLRAGLFLMPFGLLNEHHEPTNFYGVQRNFVETLIIPSTWREGGFNVHGDTASGFSWNVGVTTGFDLSKWNYAPEFPLYTTALDLEDNDIAPLQATHQELALANAHALSQYVALGYYGIPGVTLGAAIFTGDAVKVPAPPNAPIPGDQRVTLWEAHARWTPGKFDLSALYAHGAISNLALANAANPGSPNPIPSQFYGYYAQAAYGLWESGDYRLAPFVRFERYDMGSKYAGVDGPVIPAGELPLSANPGDYGYWPQYQDRVWTVGANFYTTPHVVFKADYQWFHVNSDFSRFDLGLGLNF